MPKPVKIGDRYYLRVRTPKSAIGRFDGRKVSIKIGEQTKQVTLQETVKVSLGTSDPNEAKHRFVDAYAALQRVWNEPEPTSVELTHKQLVAVAGEIRTNWVSVFDDDPGGEELWANVVAANEIAMSGQSNALRIGPPEPERMIEERFGGIVDGFLRTRGILLADRQRAKLLKLCGKSLIEAAEVNRAKASGDYSDDEQSRKYPELVLDEPTQEVAAAVTFEAVIDAEVKKREAGRGSAPMRPETERKFRLAVKEFSGFRRSTNAATVTAREGDAWKYSMQDEGELTNNTIAQRIQNVRTVLEWVHKQSFGELYPGGNPLKLVDLPRKMKVPQEELTFRLEEAKAVLLAARAETRPELRWLPWACAYSGTRINEAAQLAPDDFFQLEGRWYYRITTLGKRKLKNEHSLRTIPVHPKVLEEGLMEFVLEGDVKGSSRLFPLRSATNVGQWVRNKVGITRPELQPNHGWRHLFEDLGTFAGMQEGAKTYITGRTQGKSSEKYGKSDVMLPGLADEMDKIPSILDR
ncbi:DUF6538 domain-containing protein [Aliiroseovarius crassostreae]|uniref:DUF6538 domain-containing protein n=1 Tax=Aliiroseovarius crassostreae TaxID=154981 RepID=UPI00220874CC|nr:DUF6538 domain-containing protein [Aliiroseovarius crassostreae]UWP99461.1 hypothetical protein K3X53_04770 [Aliiroseovarius crassostreae]